ncbi:MAG: calcineurin-like phosphoesterase family protein [Firmicutes bacterium]|nr:calcineurin-like phosphoesterase family protein [Bacillota bacterium]MCM1401483.1 calcineurin-like phosphoesterase family protein [Bacteroides sp.]MCM1477418.1 calcineurin-like phosphoesterase family protein [Bacteroides sp.]
MTSQIATRLCKTALIAAGLLFSCLAVNASNSKINPRKGMTVTGRVTVDGKPRQGVVVSDGVHIVTTDKLGEYQLPSHGRQHVFVSVPANCEVPLENGLPKFYSEITDTLAPSQHDFALKSAPVKERWTLLAIADPQIGVRDTLDYAGIVMPQIKRLTDSLPENTYGITLGDVVWNAPRLYSKYASETARLGIPVFSVIGNHDHNEKVHNDTESDREFRNNLGPTYYSANIGSCHIVAIDDILYSGKKNRNDYAGRITDQQLAWLKKDLEHVPHDKTIILGLHIPTSRRNAPGWTLANSDTLYSLLKPFKRVEILSGHTHYQFTTTIAPNITETTLGAAMGAYWYPICNDGSPRGVGVLEFDGPELVNKYYVGAGLPRSYQMKLYAPAEAVLWNPDVPEGTPYNKVLINIFCWHTDWNVEVSEDGGEFKPLPADARLIPEKVGGRCWDPSVRKALVNGKLPANHGGSKPADINDHMFLYTPADGWKSITVRATDPFGNIYTESLRNPETTAL